MNVTELILFAAVSCAGILVQSTVGFAGGLLAIPLLTLFLSPRDAVPSYCLVMLAVQVLLLLEARAHIEWRRIVKFFPGVVVGAPLGAFFLSRSPTFWIGVVINAVTLLFAVLYLLRVRISFRDGLPTHVGVGMVSGLLGGLTAQSGPPVVIFGISRGWPKDAFRANLLGYFTFLSTITAGSFVANGLVQKDELLRFATALVPALAVSQVGIFIKSNLGEGVFRKVVLGVVIGVSVIGLANQFLRFFGKG